MAHGEYVSLSAGVISEEEATKNADKLSQAMQPKFVSACGVATKLIFNKFEEFLAAEEATAATEQARMSLNVSKAVQSVHNTFFSPAATGEITDEDLKQAEAKFRSDTKKLHAANYHAAYQAVRTEKAAAALDAKTAEGATAEVLTQHEKQLHANERLNVRLLKKRNDLVMDVLGRSQAAPKPNYTATESALNTRST